jgi:hypothetical protein
MQDDVIQGEALAIREETHSLAAWTPRFAVAVDEAIDRKREKNRFFQEVMDEGLHYGVIPGTGTKPTLLKPGAEMLLSNMGLSQAFSDAEPPLRDYDGTGVGGGEPLIAYRRVCRIYRQTGTREDERMLISQAEGFCSSREEKYRYRKQRRQCPACGNTTIIKGKTEYGGGWLCWKKEGKSDGCGAKFKDGDGVIEEQPEGQILNPNVTDSENTILKMADKRALVAATLLATGCSDIFTQDVEDAAPEGSEASQAPPPPKQPSAASTDRKIKDVTKKAKASAQVLRDPGPGAEGDHDPVKKGEALDACMALKRERFISTGLWQEFLKEMFPRHVSPISKIVSEGDLSVGELRAVWAEANRRTKSGSGGGSHPAPARREPVDVPTSEPLNFDGLEDEIPL